MADLFCGRCGWAREFAARGWKCFCFDLVEPSELPAGCEFIKCDVLQLGSMKGRIGVLAEIIGFLYSWEIDFACASSPCEQFALWGMRHYNPDPPYPELGIRLFNHAQKVLADCGVPHVMENVRAAQQFVGQAKAHAGSFYLWGNAVPPILPQGVVKGMTRKAMGERKYKGQEGWNANQRSGQRIKAARVATIPPELAGCVADFAESLHV